jgi:hypothetical protein
VGTAERLEGTRGNRFEKCGQLFARSDPQSRAQLVDARIAADTEAQGMREFSKGWAVQAIDKGRRASDHGVRQRG